MVGEITDEQLGEWETYIDGIYEEPGENLPFHKAVSIARCCIAEIRDLKETVAIRLKDFLKAENEAIELEIENEGLKTIIGKLPKTADEAPYVQGEKLYAYIPCEDRIVEVFPYPPRAEIEALSSNPPYNSKGFMLDIKELFATREAAERARGGG
jgi:hypothetical protein